MRSADLLTDAFGRIRDTVDEVLDGIDSKDLITRLDAEANSIAWLVWHLTRVQDDHVAMSPAPSRPGHLLAGPSASRWRSTTPTSDTARAPIRSRS